MEIKTLGQAWEIMRAHGLAAGWCPGNCDHFAFARVLSRQDEIISELLKVCKSLLSYARELERNMQAELDARCSITAETYFQDISLAEAAITKAESNSNTL